MRSSFYLFAALLVVAPTLVQGQYDFDDFLQAVESGKSKSVPPSRIAPRVAQRTDAPLPGPADAKGTLNEVPSITETREVPPTSILPTPNPDVMRNPLSETVPQKPAAAVPQSPVPELEANQVQNPLSEPMPLSMIDSSEADAPLVGSSVNESPVAPSRVPNQAHSDSGSAVAPEHIDFQSLFEQPQANCNCTSMPTAATGCASCSPSFASQASCSVMPYRQANLPAPSSLRGYFNASPCFAHVWDDYACEAAAACAKLQNNHWTHGCPPVGQVYECGGLCGSGCGIKCGGKYGNPNCH